MKFYLTNSISPSQKKNRKWSNEKIKIILIDEIVIMIITMVSSQFDEKAL